MIRCRVAAPLVLLAASLAHGTAATTARQSGDVTLLRVMQAEDRRAGGPDDLQLLRTATGNPDAEVRRTAARALGRLERPELAADLLPLLDDAAAQVRAMAAFALGQAADATVAESLREPLAHAATADPDPNVRGAAATALGRLPVPAGSLGQVRDLLVGLAELDAGTPAPARLGALRGLEAMIRRLPAEAREALLLGGPGATLLRVALGDGQVRDRRLAIATLTLGTPPEASILRQMMQDPDPEMRRRTVGAARALLARRAAPEARALAVEASRGDPDARVRYAALAALRATGTEEPPCADVRRSAAEDPSAHVRLLAIDLLADCPDARDLLDGLAGTLADRGPGDWHEAAHALVSLAAVDAAGSAGRRAQAAGHPVWQVRMYTARAGVRALADPSMSESLRAGERARLQVLAIDHHANVASAAIDALRQHDPDGLTDPVIEALARDDEQLLLVAADALDGIAPRPGVVEALLTALTRLSGRGRQTARDPRLALLRRIGADGDRRLAARIEPYLRDYDPMVASAAADLLEDWTGERPEVRPRPLDPLPFPDLERLRELRDARFQVHMTSGDTFIVRLRPFSSPTNAARFARLAASGAFERLSFHRVEPNFVIQGLSPGANEYAGYGSYTRDEIGPRSHLRGTVGLSTRGRDTGDGQIFVNLVDNERLDFDYTILGDVVEGMDAVDRILEGAVVERVTMLPRR